MHECYFLHLNRCRILNISKCQNGNCSFRKTLKEYLDDYEKAENRLKNKGLKAVQKIDSDGNRIMTTEVIPK